LFRQRVERLKRTAPIAEVIGRYVNLKNTGSTFIGTCPFPLLSELTGTGTPVSRFLGHLDGSERVARMRLPIAAVPITQGPAPAGWPAAPSAGPRTGDRATSTDRDA
ncbi:MAG: CHC2 zinc finger domain-containing protein, partial [Bryobacteraceae bacterium]